MKITFVGDVHGKWFKPNEPNFTDIIEQHKDSDYVFQVGDMGFGFPDTKDLELFLPPNVLFIRGNHDNPSVCEMQPNYLGDYGYHDETGIFYLSGADSPDESWRIFGVSHWQNEELDYLTLQKAADMYVTLKPKIVVTHECPCSIGNIAKDFHIEQNRTSSALDFFFREHKPRYWFFGHHHTPFRKNILGTNFVCVPTLQAIEMQYEKETLWLP